MTAKREPWVSLLGLAYRARKVVSGEETVLQTIRKQKAKAVLLAGDASERTRKTITDKCRFYRVPLLIVTDRTTLGSAIGKRERVVAAVTDQGFGEKLIALLDPSNRG